MTIEEKKAYGKLLYTKEKLDAKVVAARVKVTEKTIGKWAKEGNWRELRNRLIVTKENQIDLLYEQLESLSKRIKESEEGHANTKQADILIKYSAAIKNLETDLNIAELVGAGMQFIKHIQKIGSFDQVQEVAELWDSFLQNQMSGK